MSEKGFIKWARTDSWANSGKANTHTRRLPSLASVFSSVEAGKQRSRAASAAAASATSRDGCRTCAWSAGSSCGATEALSCEKDTRSASSSVSIEAQMVKQSSSSCDSSSEFSVPLSSVSGFALPWSLLQLAPSRTSSLPRSVAWCCACAWPTLSRSACSSSKRPAAACCMCAATRWSASVESSSESASSSRSRCNGRSKSDSPDVCGDAPCTAPAPTSVTA
eukprot:1167826-Pleurochrysis_carterae.AAC.4